MRNSSLEKLGKPFSEKTLPMHENMISLFMIKCLHYEKK